ncbi:MAG: helicase-related protein [Anaerolineaceae bacterium]|nr:helicase-related protein [Anaerolineaceae bacterium]
MTEYTDVRNYLLAELEKDLIGPAEITEELTDSPTTHYLSGVLYPAGTEMDREEDKDQSEASLDDDDLDTGAMIAMTTNPSSIGLTFAVNLGEELKVSISAGTYAKNRVEKKTYWRRSPVLLDPLLIKIEKSITRSFHVTPGLDLFLRVKKLGDLGLVTLSLINRHINKEKISIDDEKCFFQPLLKVESSTENNPVFLRGFNYRQRNSDPDRLQNNLLYRHSPEFSVGHGCAVMWDERENENATALRTSIIPRFEVPQMSADSLRPFRAQSLKFLSDSNRSDLISGLSEFLDDYERWVTDLDPVIDQLEDRLKEPARINRRNCYGVLSRMRAGVSLLESDEEARKAFQLSNHAMLLQRSRVEWLKQEKEIRSSQPELLESFSWRPFQLGFLLLCIRSIAIPQSPERDSIDLLWFPTGGGKTEAYLGLTAFTIFLRRIRAGGDPVSAGVTVLMRYTLRLLTLQQYQRASALILACEHIRRQEPELLGKDPVEIGLWVGGGATPNTHRQAKESMQKILNGDPVYESNPYVIRNCPWCGHEITPRDYHFSAYMTIKCPDSDCQFSGGLPLYLVDDDIYARQPSLLIGTVDKFARVPWLAKAGTLFGRKGKITTPPELIIQDELHLISGPLGTLVGLYETAIDALCDNNSIPPKVIASTATIRRAASQVRALFNRSLAQFPPPGIDSRDSYFARQTDISESPGRLYIGFFAPGKSMKTAIVRIYANLLQKIHELQVEPHFKDPYWTLVGYFNSLRELGGAVRLAEDDIRERIKVIARRTENMTVRKTEAIQELNSRIASSTIPEVLNRMSREIGDPAAIDLILASNMISVGVDIDRLGLMVVTGQPKITSEYIQATSRIGRKYPGLVITLYNWTRPRDRSHYEKFIGYHSALYSQVEPTGVTPFSSRARDRGLPGVFISLVRHLSDDMNPDEAAVRLTQNPEVVERAKNIILKRIEEIDPDEMQDAGDEIDMIIERWASLASDGELLYSASLAHPEKLHLMLSPENFNEGDTDAFNILNSLRDVEGETDLYIFRPGGNK